MKKIILSFVIGCAFLCGYAADEFVLADSKSVLKEEFISSNYEYVRPIKALVYGSRGTWFYNGYGLYKGVNTCDAYYLKESNGGYIADRPNSYETYKGKDVSEYKHMAYGSDGDVYFYNF